MTNTHSQNLAAAQHADDLASKTLKELLARHWHLSSVGLSNCRAAQALQREIERRQQALVAADVSPLTLLPETTREDRADSRRLLLEQLTAGLAHLQSVGLANSRGAQIVRGELSRQLFIQSELLANANFNSDEPRDSHGQWTTNAANTPTNNPSATNNPAATNSPSATTIPPSKVRAMIVAAALQNKGSEKWLRGKTVGNFGPKANKCNKFVADNCNSTGLGTIVPDIHTTHNGHKYPPTARDWADPSVNIPGWVVVTNPQPGDVAAQKHFYIDATGHCAIVVRVGGSYGGLTVGTDSYFNDTIVQTDWGFRPDQKGKVVFRRYIGVPKK